MEGWRVASKGLGPLPRRRRRGALAHGCGRGGSGALPLPRAALLSTGLSVLVAHDAPIVLAHVGDAHPAEALADGREVVVLDVELVEVDQLLDARRDVAAHRVVVQVEVPQRA